ncbi:hypothetical protein [Microbacterium candidum]|uniref:Uncharacterized protein n=1 Tax=Microbacterium candidum TaxID=3041922 RepID=A0ABT7N147_9MICO|nr:hypothetical protein [Microbacterium sp. ASV49]MDL9980436.1 hypothetical protein [Microbacterium sp. ASV49]
MMHILAISTVTDSDRFWDGMKKAHGRLPRGAAWRAAVADTGGTRAVNVISHDSLEAVQTLLDEHAHGAAITECFEADAANAVGLPRTAR